MALVPGPKRFEIGRNSFMKHYTVTSPQSNEQYHVDVSTYTPGKPDLTMHAGPSTSTPILAVAHLTKFSFSFKIGVGDPATGGNSVQWEDLHRENIRQTEYSITTNINGQRRTLTWKTTHHHAVDGGHISAFSERNYKFVDAATGEVLAMFTSDRSLSRCGALQINVDYGKQFESLVLMSYLAIYEKAKRNRRRRAAAAGGGGGGGG